ncbi:ATP-dependent RNA helicase-like protein [Leishmania mexicana MHOM/GT/2001/U1103]|uniref:RNA helicase n=1 Tax=Leishmania mexicana (strain MHOM/GT/2001/U1103) TaxID=929439 RepID=E9B4U2_LEIMU|nr:ATP-dependent RNA helicase-like protein [Leishmania mexicana MHOM/GT/2001/U1103]CBZ30261.1 ATP-dependent RNA helicase-like protein [Leishmania mexicana MHOM/GT/2001/U1103]
MLRSDHQQADPDAEFVMPEPSMHHVPHSQLWRCVLELPLNGRCHGEDAAEKEVFAIGQSKKAKVARALCFMHAEQLLDHYMSIRKTPLSSRTGVFPAPPPLEERALPPRPKTPKPHDYRLWDEYVDASSAYVQAVAAHVKQEACTREEVPRSGHPVADRATELLRRHPKRYCRPTALHDLNGSIRDASTLMKVAHLDGTVFVATLTLDPQTGLAATGVAKNTKTAKRQCAAHALCILRLLQEDAEGRQGADGTGRSRRRGAQKGTRSKKDVSHHPSAPLESILQQMQPAYRKLVQYHHLLFGKASLTPQTTFTKESSTTSGSTSTTIYRCHLTLNGLSCDGTGINRFEAERAAMEAAMTDLMLYDKRIQAVQAFVNAHPSISPESIPSAALPAELVAELQTQLWPVTEQQAAAAANAATESATERRGSDDGSDSADDCSDRARGMNERTLLHLSERAFATDASYAAQMLHDMLDLRRDPVYLAQFHPRRSTLAMAAVKAQVLDAVQRHRVAVVCGTTGCGKTTQVPQYILDYEIEHGRGGSCNILVTQPRRLSAFSVAERIAQERLSTVGKDVGYAVRLDSRPGRHITVCTTGVLLQIFSTHPDLEHVSHLIIDEVHERDINCDVILALVKQLLTRNPRLRVVLMSATMQADVFARYFGADTPVVQVEGAVYPVTIHYLEDIASEAATAQFYSPAFDAVSSGEQGQQEKTPTKSVTLAKSPTTASRRVNRRKFLKTDYNLVAYLVHRAVQVDLQNNTEGKSILVFLPGWKELTSAMAAIKEYHGPYALPAADSLFHIILLHSTVDSAKQRECFMPAPSGTVKVVLATNIAESGITIDDAAVVIDTGLIKTTTWESRPTAAYQHVTTGTGGSSSSRSPTFAYVPLDKVAVKCGSGGDSSGDAVVPTPVFSTQLTLGYASQANCTQRKGRAGRTQGGVCYRLFTKELWDSLPAFPEADIHRVPLMQVLLKLLSLGHPNPKETLQTFLEPPSSTNVDASMEVLRGIGAVGTEDRLTPLGEYLALLPCDPRIGKMIIVGAVLRCLDSVLTVAACTDVCPYATSRDVAAEARKKRYLLSCGSQSDHISFLNAYNAFCANGEKDDFATFNLLHTGNLAPLGGKAQYRDILRHAGLISPQDEFGGDPERVDDADAVSWPEHGHLGNDGGAVEDIAIHSEGGKAVVSAVDSSAQGAPVSEPAPLSYPGTLCVDTNALSRHSFDVALVKACVCAALFPNVALLRPPSKALSSMQRLRAARKVELRTKHFTSIKPAKDSVCRRVDGSCGNEVPDRDEVLSQFRRDSRAATEDSATSSTSPVRPVPALFYVFQDVFGLREPRRDFLTSLSAVSLWALLLFGASESTTEYNAELSICVVDGWIALHIDRATYALVTQLRQSLFECLRGKYNNPQDPRHNSALETVTAVCRRLLKAPVLEMAAATSPDTAGSAAAGRQQSPWQLVDMGSIVDPLVHLRHGDFGNGRAAAVAGEDALLDLDDSVDGDDDDDEDLPNSNPVDGRRR